MAETCRHDGPRFRVRDDAGVASISCASCIADELETQLAVGVPVAWEIERPPDDEEEGP